MLVIIDGPRGSGKDTIIRQLVQSFAVPGKIIHVFHNIQPFARDRETMLETFLEQAVMGLESPEKITIINRAHYSEGVYGHIHRDTSPWDPLTEDFEERLTVHSKPIHTFILTAPASTLLGRRQARQRHTEPPLLFAEIAHEIAVFRHVTQLSRLNPITIDTSRGGIQDVLQHIRRSIPTADIRCH